MVKKVFTRFAVAKKPGLPGGTMYRSPRIYLPTKLTDDSSFPFKEGDIISIKVDGRRLLIQRVRKASENAEPKERTHNTAVKPSRSGQ